MCARQKSDRSAVLLDYFVLPVGKTATITARVVRLLLEGRKPIAVLTFTKKGAAELERRIRGGLDGTLATPSTRPTASSCPVNQVGEKDLFVGTFHSFFMMLLRNHGGSLGVPGNFKVLGPFQQLTLLRSLIEREKRTQAQRPGVGRTALSAALFSNPQDPQASSDENEECSENEVDLQASFLDGGSHIGSTSREAEELRKHIRSMKLIPELLQRERAVNSILYRLFCEYTLHLKKQQPPLLDFTDLTVLAIRLLERDDTRQQLGLLWPYLVIDEFQDTNRNQFKFLSLLALQGIRCGTLVKSSGKPRASRGITVVGDDDQSIYKWRGTHTGVGLPKAVKPRQLMPLCLM